ncbi:MAG: VTC domain-containing protein [Planctomycetota bacterium]|jgi:hypothetical protein
MFEDLLNRVWEPKAGMFELLENPHQPTGHSHRGRRKGGSRRSHLASGRGLDLCRYELKYRISESVAEAVTQFVKPHLPLDHYCKSQPNRSYPIVSLYLDSRDLALCWQSLEGQKNRFKLRIRSYTDDPAYPRFLEIKRRLNSIIIKSRTRIKHEDVAGLICGAGVSQHGSSADEQTHRQFRFYRDMIGAEPVILVRYMRQAYEGDRENRVRVTLDRGLSFKASSRPEVTLDGGRWRHYPGHSVILEIKFTGAFPAWLSQMVRCFNLRKQSFSKYVRSLRQSKRTGLSGP